MELSPNCRESLSVSDPCRQPSQPVEADPEYPTPKNIFGYLARGFAIAGLRSHAIIATAGDRNALRYGSEVLAFVLFTVAIVTRYRLFRGLDAYHVEERTAQLLTLIVASILAACVGAVLYVATIALFHLAARLLLRGRGTYSGLLRPLLLASPVMLFQLIPWIGFIISGFWQVAILMYAAEEVEHIGRMHALALSFVANVLALAFFQTLIALVTPAAIWRAIVSVAPVG